MNRPVSRVLTTTIAAAALAAAAAGCGTEKVAVPKSDPNYASDYQAAQLFNQRCAGCHTLSYAGTFGSAANVRTKEAINGPNFNVRCEKPVDRVLYAIENGGFSGAYMPANIFVGQQARQVAMFVATYAGRQAPLSPGVTPCVNQAIGALPPPASATATIPAPVTTSTTAATTTSTTVASTKPKSKKKHKKKK